MRAAAVIGVIVVLVCLSGIAAGFLIGRTAPSSIDSNSVSNSLPEYLVITNLEYTVGTPGSITVMVNNTGISRVRIVKLMIDNVKQSTNPQLPITIEPDQGMIINATLNITIKGYQIDIYTSNGNLFSKSDPGITTFAFMGTSSITVTNVNFSSGNPTIGVPKTIELCVKNTGTRAVTITTVRVNNQIAIFSTSNSTINPGDFATLSVGGEGGNWFDGNTYKIDIFDGSGQVVGSMQYNAPGA